MQIALLSDIHSNVHALNACLRDAQERGAERFAFLGDFVGYGGDPCGVIRIITEHVAKGAIALKGNHDEAVHRRSSNFSGATQDALVLARSTLDTPQKRFLAALPLIVREDAMCFVHATAAFPEMWEYIESPGAALRCANAAQTTYTFCGHVHDQTLYFENGDGTMRAFHPMPGVPVPVRGGRRWVAIVGSVGQPRDGNPDAAYAIFDTTRLQITFHRLKYDAASAANQIRKAGLPESLANRIEQGI